MQVSRRTAAILCATPLGACAIVGPLSDRGMENAPYAACARFEAVPAAAASPQCLAVFIRAGEGRWQPFSSGAIGAGDELLALPSDAPQCRHGNFTHVVLSGSAAGAGAMKVVVPDGFTRGDRGRTLRWQGPRQRWTIPNVGTALHLPAGVRISLLAGEVRLSEACLKSYTRWRIPPPPAAAREGQEH